MLDLCIIGNSLLQSTKGNMAPMGAIRSCIALSNDNDGWLPASASSDPILPQQNNISKNTSNKKGRSNKAMSMATMETVMILALMQNEISMTTWDDPQHAFTNMKQRATEVQTGHTLTLPITQV